MPHNMQQLVSAMAARNAARASPMAAVDVAAVASGLHDAEVQMQACQAADRGPPAHPIKVPLFWTAGQVCDGSGCVGGAYSKALVARQIELTNAVFAHVGIQFVWDGVIHKATAGDAFDIDVGYSTSDWICQQQRHGDALAVNVMTAPIHPGCVRVARPVPAGVCVCVCVCVWLAGGAGCAGCAGVRSQAMHKALLQPLPAPRMCPALTSRHPCPCLHVIPATNTHPRTHTHTHTHAQGLRAGRDNVPVLLCHRPAADVRQLGVHL
jgi:hypothetical protein